MAGVRWLAERRVLRRASHQSLKVPVFREQSFDTLSQITPAASYASGDWDADYRRGDEDASWVAADEERAAPPTAVSEMSRPAPTPMEDESWIGDRPYVDHRTVASFSSNALTFKPASRRWYRSQRLVLALIGAAVAAMVVCVVLLVMRSSTGGKEGTTTVTPTVTTSAVPRLAPDVVDELPPPGEVPPTPPPDADNGPPPSNTDNYPRYWTPSSNDSDAPTGRPRPPAVSSFAPTVTPPPANTNSMPGGAHRRRGYFG